MSVESRAGAIGREVGNLESKIRNVLGNISSIESRTNNLLKRYPKEKLRVYSDIFLLSDAAIVIGSILGTQSESQAVSSGSSILLTGALIGGAIGVVKRMR